MAHLAFKRVKPPRHRAATITKTFRLDDIHRSINVVLCSLISYLYVKVLRFTFEILIALSCRLYEVKGSVGQDRAGQDRAGSQAGNGQ